MVIDHPTYDRIQFHVWVEWDTHGRIVRMRWWRVYLEDGAIAKWESFGDDMGP